MSYHNSFIFAVLLCLLSSTLPAAPLSSQDMNLDEEASLDGTDLPPRTSPPSKLDSEPFEVHSTG